VISPIFAALDLPAALPPPTEAGTLNPQFHDAMLILSGGAAIALFAILIFFLIHKAKNPNLASASVAALPAHERSSLFGSKRRRKKRFQRNPTLAETGGLPPRRQSASNQN
jgi:hypothetical protein